MGAFKRAFFYLTRKPGKAAILIAIMAVACCMALLSLGILETTRTLSFSLKQSAAPEIAVYEESGKGVIEDELTATLAAFESIKSINRMRTLDAFPETFSNIEGTISDPGYDEAVRLNAFDDLSLDSPFSDELVRLVDGRLLNPDDHYAAVVHVDLAEANGLTIGDRIALTTAENLHAEAEIVGLFAGAGGNEGEQGTTTARTQSFNQLYIDNTTISDLGATGYRELRLMLTDPNSIDETLAAVTQACGAGYATEVYDSALAALTPTLDRTASAAQATLALVALTGVVAVSMLLAMWGKQRTHERAILLSLGRSRAEVILQALIESMVLFALAALISSVVASILMPLLSNNLIPSAALAAAQAVGMSITGGLSPADVAWISGVGFLMASTLTATCTAITLRRNPRDLLVEKR